ncbi:MAG: hypothetical protein M0P52_15150 [Rhodoferax sp.]|nr:hypothetical protein [Rhodoferax sp.]
MESVIKNVVDDGQQRKGRVVNDVGHVHLRAVEAALLQHIDHADHPVHGSSDLVAHGGQKFGLGAVGVFGGSCGNAERCVFFFQRLVQLLLDVEQARSFCIDQLGQFLLVLPVNQAGKGACRQQDGEARQHNQREQVGHAAQIVGIILPGKVFLQDNKLLHFCANGVHRAPAFTMFDQRNGSRCVLLALQVNGVCQTGQLGRHQRFQRRQVGLGGDNGVDLAQFGKLSRDAFLRVLVRLQKSLITGDHITTLARFCVLDGGQQVVCLVQDKMGLFADLRSLDSLVEGPESGAYQQGNQQHGGDQPHDQF